MVLWLIAAVLLFFLLFVAQPPGQSLGTGQCVFGTYGYFPGRVWVKIAAYGQPVSRNYTVVIRWGPKLATVKQKISDEFYFTMTKDDFHSPPADVTVTPDAWISCGNGLPPDGAPSRAVVGNVWKHVPYAHK